MRHRIRLHVAFAFVCVGLACAPALAGNMVLWGGNVYEYVETYMKWDQAKDAAASMSYLGYPGRLATITSAQEQAAVLSIIPTHWSYNAMLGGSDRAVEGTWVWETGPEAGTIFWKDGLPYNGAYTAWRPGEPNAVTPSEDHLVMYQHQWIDSPANDFIHRGFIVEYRLAENGFDFGMNGSHMLAVRNISPEASLVALDITLPGDSFFDTAPTPPGSDYARWSVVAASAGASFVVPDGSATDGQQTITIQLDLGPTEAVHFDVDLDRLSIPEGEGLADGTKLLAHFRLGDIEYTIPATVHAGDMEILGTSFPYSVRATNAAVIPEPTTTALLAGGLLVLQMRRRRRARPQA